MESLPRLNIFEPVRFVARLLEGEKMAVVCLGLACGCEGCWPVVNTTEEEMVAFGGSNPGPADSGYQGFHPDLDYLITPGLTGRVLDANRVLRSKIMLPHVVSAPSCHA